MKHLRYFIALFFVSCSVSKQISRSAKETVLTNKALTNAHVGLSIFEPATNKYWFNHQGDKYFVPASNTKLPTCYAAMKYLGDSLVALTYDEAPDGTTYIQPNADPTFLLSEFKFQPIYELLKKPFRKKILIDFSGWQEESLGSGWSWNDYEEYYMAERSLMPVFGNMIQFNGRLDSIIIIPRKVVKSLIVDSSAKNTSIAAVHRNINTNDYLIVGGAGVSRRQELTFDTEDGRIIVELLQDTLKIPVEAFVAKRITPYKMFEDRTLKSQPTDSVIRLMMHRSDNFFAEQLLLMVCNHYLGYMKNSKIIETLLKTDFKDLPQKPRWADGSGLSRYNLFTPQDFVMILNKMKNEFGMDRIKVILPTGGEGTISSYYKADSNYIFGKTGTLSGVVAFSGFMYTKKGKLLIFSTLVNNHQATATDVRRAIEKFLQGVRNHY